MASAPAATTPRRLSPTARRQQLVNAALALLARQGPVDLSLDAVARRAGVTRNLVYHYFPDGRGDLVAAATEEAERQLLGEPAPATATGPATTTHTPTATLTSQGLEEAVSRILDHALAPTHAWRVHRLARGAGHPAATQVVELSTHRIVDAIAAAIRPGEPFSATANLALRGYVAFAEDVLDGARLAGLSRAHTRRVLAQALAAIASIE